MIPAASLTITTLKGLSAGVLLLGAGEILDRSGWVSSLLLHPSDLENPAKQWKTFFLFVFFSASMAISSVWRKINL